MPDLDATAITAVEGSSFAPAFYIYLDVLETDLVTPDPIRVTTFGQDTTFSGTGDADLDGKTFTAFGGQLIDISDISDSEGGSDTFSITLSGIVSMDTTLINEIGNKGCWQGREGHVWTQIYDESGVTPQGAIIDRGVFYMSSVRISAEPESQVIELTGEKYLSFHSRASNRSYLNQKDYDAADTSAAATLAAANGLRRGTGAGSGSTGGGSGLTDGGFSDHVFFRPTSPEGT